MRRREEGRGKREEGREKREGVRRRGGEEEGEEEGRGGYGVKIFQSSCEDSG